MLIQSKLLLKPEPFTKTPTQKQILSSKQFIQASHTEYKYFSVYTVRPNSAEYITDLFTLASTVSHLPF